MSRSIRHAATVTACIPTRMIDLTKRSLLLLSLCVAACGKSDSTSGAPAAAKAAEPAAPAKPAEPAPAAKVAEPPPAALVPCDAKALDALSADLDRANGHGVDLTVDGAKARIDEAKHALLGKAYALAGCTFKNQGNDQVTFSAAGSTQEVECTMKDGEAGVRAFRTAAMSLDQDKLKLDVRGTVATVKDVNGFEHVSLTGCQIQVHE